MAVSQLIREHERQIIERWMAAPEDLFECTRPSGRLLQDEVSEMIRRLASCLEEPAATDAKARLELLQLSSFELLRTDRQLRAAIAECRLLRAAILGVVLQHTALPDLTAVARLDEALDCIIEDVVERYTAEQRRQRVETQERHQLALEASNLGTWELEPRTGQVLWSAHLKALFGVPLDQEITYEFFLSQVHPQDRGDVRAHIEGALRGRNGSEVDLDYRVQGNGGRPEQRWSSCCSWRRSTSQKWFAR